MAGLLGFDISTHNSDRHPIQWSQIGTNNVQFVFIKATEGATYEDPWFDRHWTAAHSQNLVRGAYHFYRSNRTGKEQAVNIIKHVLQEAQLGSGDLPLAIDVEELKSVDTQHTSNSSISAFLEELKTCISSVEEVMGARPLIYTANYVWKALGNPSQFEDYPLWIAFPDSAASEPVLPSPFSEYSVWQYSFQGKLEEVTGPVDLDRFNGTDAAFKQLLLP